MFNKLFDTVKDIASTVAIGQEFSKEFSISKNLLDSFEDIKESMNGKGTIVANSIDSGRFIINYTEGFSEELPCVITIEVLSSTPNTTILKMHGQSKNPLDSQQKVIDTVNCVIDNCR